MAPANNSRVEPSKPDDLDAQLCRAAFVCDFVRVRELLAQGASPNVRDDDMRTPLHQAVLGNSVGLVGLLIEAGADLDAKDAQDSRLCISQPRNTCPRSLVSWWARART